MLAATGRDAEKIKEVETLLRRFELDTDEDNIAEEKTQGTKDPSTIRKAPIAKVDLALDDQRQTLQLKIGNYSYTYTYISRIVQEMRNLYSSLGDDDEDFDVDDDDFKDEEEEEDDDMFVIDEDTLTHDILLNMVVEKLYTYTKAGNPHSYFSVFSELGWEFHGMEKLMELDDGGDLLQQVLTLTYPAKFTCVELDENGKPIKEEKLPPGWAHPCYARLVPLLEVIDAPSPLPDMMHRHKRVIMDRFNTVHSAVKRKIEKDERLEAVRQADEMRAAKQSEQ